MGARFAGVSLDSVWPINSHSFSGDDAHHSLYNMEHFQGESSYIEGTREETGICGIRRKTTPSMIPAMRKKLSIWVVPPFEKYGVITIFFYVGTEVGIRQQYESSCDGFDGTWVAPPFSVFLLATLHR